MASWLKRKLASGDTDPKEDNSLDNQYGLFVLYPTKDHPRVGPETDVDIVAIHGLGGAAKKTWTDKATGHFWLEDFLPNAIPNARIMTFGYASRLAFSNSRAGIESYARDILNRLKLLRTADNSQNRRVIFIAHSLGGIVVKKALILAHEEGGVYGHISRSTRGILFLGTPHRGSDLVNWTSSLSKIANAVTFGQALRSDLLQNLSRDALPLMEISDQFVHQAASLRIISFTENMVERPLTTLVVENTSAVMGIPNELVVPINAHHRGMCRYASKDNNYNLLEGMIMEIVRQTAGVPQPTGQRTIPLLSHMLPGTHGGPVLQRKTEHPELPKEEKIRSLRPPKSDGEQQLGSGRVHVRIVGLRKKLTVKTYNNRLDSRTIIVTGNTSASDLRYILAKQHPDIVDMEGTLGMSAFGHEIGSFWWDVFTTPVQVTAGRSCYNLSKGLKINERQSIASFFSKAFPNPIEARPCFATQAGKTTPPGLFADTISIGKLGKGDKDLMVSFVRTVRIPEDQKDHDLPPGLGRFPLFDVATFSDRLPVGMAIKGGLFIPMYQMEAMWINFECAKDKRFAVRIFLGGVNGITGEPTVGDMNALLRRMNGLARTQDYIVLPEQKWLDGISTSPGTVRQFVAAEMALPSINSPRQDLRGPSTEVETTPGPSGQDLHFPMQREPAQQLGASVEWQVTGQDSVGGVQIQIIPQFDTARMFACSVENTCREKGKGGKLKSYKEVSDDARELDVLNSPKTEGFTPGSFIHVKDLDLDTSRPLRDKTMADVLLERPPEYAGRADHIEMELYSEYAKAWKLTISQFGSPTAEIVLEVSTDDDFAEVTAVARDLLGVPCGLLFFHCHAANDADALSAVNTWKDLETLHEFAGAQTAPSMFNLVCAPHSATSSRLCHVWLMAQEIRPGRQETPLTFALVSDATISQLKAEIEQAMGIPGQTFYVTEKGQQKPMPSHARVFPDIHDHVNMGAEFVALPTKETGSLLIFVAVEKKTCILEVDPSKTVSDILRLACLLDDYANSRVLCSGTLLVLDRELCNQPCQICTGSLLVVYRRLTIYVEFMATQKLYRLYQYKYQQCWVIKAKLEKLGVPARYRPLLCDGQILAYQTLSAVGVQEGSVLELHEEQLGGGYGVIRVRGLAGEELNITGLKVSHTVRDAKRMIQKQLGIPCAYQRLTIDNVEPEDDCLLTLFGLDPVIDINLHSQNELICIRHEDKILISKGTSVLSVKMYILESRGIPVKEQTLSFMGTILKDGESTERYTGGKTMLDLYTPMANVQSLAMGAGGNIVQRIEPDDNDPRFWDVASSKMLHIQILDSRAFLKVTGRRPPDTPVTPDMYKHLRLPFYKLWSDEMEQATVPEPSSWPSIQGAKAVASSNTATSFAAHSIAPSGKDKHPAGSQELVDPLFNFPVVLMAVDDTIGSFHSVVDDFEGGDMDIDNA